MVFEGWEALVFRALGKCRAFFAFFMSDGLGKIKKAKKVLHSVGKKQVLGGVGKKPLERWGALDWVGCK